MSGLRLFGHPVHAACSHFPMALLVLSPLADATAWWLDEETFWQLGFWGLTVGIVAAIPTVLAGFVDLAKLPPGSRAASTALWHMSMMLAAVGSSTFGLVLRQGTLAAEGAMKAVMALEIAGASLLLVGGWLGGELVFRHGVGVRTERPRPEED